MSNNPNTHTYYVYMPESTESYPIDVPANPSLRVRALALAIDEDPFVRKVLNPNASYKLFKYCEKHVKPPAKLNETVVKWLSTNPWDEKMDYASFLSEHFPEGPASQTEKKIDVIIATDAFLEGLRLATPENRAPLDVELTPRKQVAEKQSPVTMLLERHEAKLREYLGGPAWSKFWEASPFVEENSRTFINGLKIPEVDNYPALLLHELGKDIVDSSILDKIFSDGSKFLVNTSGSGKTRLLFEGLTRYWGFYFTTVVGPANNYLGSIDLSNTIEHDIPSSAGFVVHPESLPVERQRLVCTQNESIATRCFCRLLTVRCLVFEWFLETAKRFFPDRPITEFKKHWLFLQLQPNRLHNEADLFRALLDVLKDAGDAYLLRRTQDARDRLSALQNGFGLDKKFYLIVDEVQVALHRLDTCFRSDQNQSANRPVLKPLIKTWQDLVTSVPMIVTGTGISLDLLNEVVTSAVVKRGAFSPVTTTGAFDDQDRQCTYMVRYMPPHVSQSDSGQALINRAWAYCRGRHRFTAELMGHLLKFSFQSPHTILNAYIERFSGYSPSDGGDYVKGEGVPEGLPESMQRVLRLDFSKIISDPEMLREISEALYSWILLQERILLFGVKKQLVELGFARFGGIDEAYADEPLVLLLAANEFADTVHSFNTYVTIPLRKEDGRGENFERYIAFYLSCAFDGKKRLCDIFSFGETPPVFAREAAELVSIALTDGRVKASIFNLLSGEVATSAIGFNAKKMRNDKKAIDQTIEWLANPWTLMCFPDKLMGPDIVLFVRVAKVILTVLVQCKWRAKKTLDLETIEDAERSLDLDKLFVRKVLTEENSKSGRASFFKLVDRVNEGNFVQDRQMEWDGWLQGGYPVLRVIASYPAETRDSINYPLYATLDMDNVEILIDKERFLRSIAESLGVRKRPIEEDP